MINTSKQVKTITYNGTPLDLYQEELKLQDKTLTFTTNGTHEVVADNGYNGLGNISLIVNVANSGGGPSLLDNYSFVYTESNDLRARQYGLAINTRSNLGQSGQYSWYISPDAKVGSNVMSYLLNKSATNSSRYYFGFFYAGTSAAPTLTDMKSSTNFSNIGVYKYTTVTMSNPNSINIGNLVLFDADGKILANDAIANVVTALSNKTIDLSNGIYFGCTNVPNATSSVGNSITLSFGGDW